MFCLRANRKNSNCIKWDTNQGTIPFGIADSDFYMARPIKKALVKRAKGVFGYSFYSEEYKNTVVEWFEKRFGYKVTKDQICGANGIVFAINFLVQTLTKPTDSIIIQPPVYNMFTAVLNKNKRNIVKNDLIKKGNTFEIDFVDLENKMKDGAKMLIFCSPHNPTGNVWSVEDVSKVVQLCKKYDVILIADEIHCDLILFDNVFTSAGKYLNEYKNIIICTAPSKTFNLAGFFTSNIVFGNPEHKKLFENKLDETCCTAPNIFGALACETAYKHCEKWLEKQNKYLSKNFLYMKEFFTSYFPQSEVMDLQGTYLAFVNLQFLGLNDKELDKLFRDNGVSMNFGSSYGDDYNGYVRINLACPKSQLKCGLERIKIACDSVKH